MLQPCSCSECRTIHCSIAALSTACATDDTAQKRYLALTQARGVDGDPGQGHLGSRCRHPLCNGITTACVCCPSCEEVGEQCHGLVWDLRHKGQSQARLQTSFAVTRLLQSITLQHHRSGHIGSITISVEQRGTGRCSKYHIRHIVLCYARTRSSCITHRKAHLPGFRHVHT